MIGHDLTNECAACNGTGVIRSVARRGAQRHVIATCSCPSGRSVANTTAAYSVVSAVGAIGKAFR